MAADDERTTGAVVTGDAAIDRLLNAAGGHLDATATVTSVDPSAVLDRIVHESEPAAPVVGRIPPHDADAAGDATASSHRPRRPPGRRYLVPLSAAAAALVVTFTGVGVTARDAQPGDVLWGVTQVLYPDRTTAVDNASFARAELNAAESAIDSGNRAAAEAALRSAKLQMQAIDDQRQITELRAAHASLAARVDHHEDPPSTPSAPASFHPPQGTGT